MLKMLFLALAVVVLLPPSVPACDMDKIKKCIGNDNHTFHLLGSLPLGGEIQPYLRTTMKVTLTAGGNPELEKVHTNSDSSFSVFLYLYLDVDVDGDLLTVDGALKVDVTANGGLVNERYRILGIDADVNVDDLNINADGIPINTEDIKLGIKAIADIAIGNHHDRYRKYLQGCFDAHAICAEKKNCFCTKGN